MVRGIFTALRRRRTEDVRRVAERIGITDIQVGTDSRSEGETTTIRGVPEDRVHGLANELRSQLDVTVDVLPELRITWSAPPSG